MPSLMRDLFCAVPIGLQGGAAHHPQSRRLPRGSTSASASASRSDRKGNSTPELVLDAADAALYRAKEAGRNCIRLDETTPS
jgi:GGDEF domain-containing protein